VRVRICAYRVLSMVARVVAMAWIDQKEVARQHLSLAAEALDRAAADAAVSRDVVAVLNELRAASVALAKMAGVAIDDGDNDNRDNSDNGDNGDRTTR